MWPEGKAHDNNNNQRDNIDHSSTCDCLSLSLLFPTFISSSIACWRASIISQNPPAHQLSFVSPNILHLEAWYVVLQFILTSLSLPSTCSASCLHGMLPRYDLQLNICFLAGNHGPLRCFPPSLMLICLPSWMGPTIRPPCSLASFTAFQTASIYTSESPCIHNKYTSPLPKF